VETPLHLRIKAQVVAVRVQLALMLLQTKLAARAVLVYLILILELLLITQVVAVAAVKLATAALVATAAVVAVETSTKHLA